ncbi:acyltransferase family protein [Oerskovia sp. M15]
MTTTPQHTRETATAPALLDPRNNSLNLIRLVLALLVLVAHSYPIAGAGHGPTIAQENLGGWAVIGFFALSGYLITGSRLRTTFGVYLTHRVARIFPAFIVCLVVVAIGFAPIGYVLQNGTISGFLTTPNTPANYVFTNSGLKMFDYSVAGTLRDVPFPGPGTARSGPSTTSSSATWSSASPPR